MKLEWKGNDITDYAVQIVWSGSAKQAARTVAFSVAYSPDDKNVKTLDINLGDKVIFYPGYPDNKKIKFSGIITSRERTSEAGSLSYTATDDMMHLLRSNGTYKFVNKTPEKIASMMARDLKLSTGSLARTNVPISKMFFSERPYYEIIMAAYTKAHKKNGKQYIAQMNGEKLEVIEKGKIISDFQLVQGEYVMNSSVSENLDSMVNRVYIYNSDNKKIGSVSNADWVKKYGVFQNTVSVDSGSGTAEAKNELSGIDKSASLNAIGDIRCTSGLGIVIKDSRTGLKGKFWIENDTHTWENGTYTMSLELAFKNVMDMQEEDEEEQASSSSGGTSSNGSTSSGSSSALNDVLNEARRWLGTGENPPGSNHNAITQYYGMDAAWCCMFIWTIFSKSGHSNLFIGGGKTAWVFDVKDYYEKRGKFGSAPRVGALIIYGNDGNSAHIGIVETVNSDGSYVTIEGNYGNMVQRRNGPGQSQPVRGFCYIDYPSSSATVQASSIEGTRVRAKFTAYYPADDPIEGGFMDAYGVPLSNWTNQGIKVIAAPPSVPKDAQVQILGTGTNRDGGIYRVRDRGGAIKIEGDNVYHFDILMSSASECNAWGVRTGYAVIKT